MTPEQKIKHAILLRADAMGGVAAMDGLTITAETVDAVFKAANEDWGLQDVINEVRQGEVETDLPTPYSRHYEAKSVAAKMPDGSWVGWTYWYGGGKHGEPEAVGWMDDAYDVTCAEEQKMVTVRTFTKQEPVTS